MRYYYNDIDQQQLSVNSSEDNFVSTFAGYSSDGKLYSGHYDTVYCCDVLDSIEEEFETYYYHYTSAVCELVSESNTIISKKVINTVFGGGRDRKTDEEKAASKAIREKIYRITSAGKKNLANRQKIYQNTSAGKKVVPIVKKYITTLALAKKVMPIVKKYIRTLALAKKVMPIVKKYIRTLALAKKVMPIVKKISQQ